MADTPEVYIETAHVWEEDDNLSLADLPKENGTEDQAGGRSL